jgi:hypothetical protein
VRMEIEVFIGIGLGEGIKKAPLFIPENFVF